MNGDLLPTERRAQNCSKMCYWDPWSWGIREFWGPFVSHRHGFSIHSLSPTERFHLRKSYLAKTVSVTDMVSYLRQGNTDAHKLHPRVWSA